MKEAVSVLLSCWRMQTETRFSPMKALGMVIFSHIRSRTSRPDSGLAMAFTTAVMTLWMVRWCSSWTPGKHHTVSDGWTEAGRMLPGLMGVLL